MITKKRVVVATLFLPYTVDFELQEKKRRATITSKDTSKNTLNLIQSLAKHQQEKSTEPQDLFDFRKPEKLVQPRSKQEREEEIRKLVPLLSVQSRRPSFETTQQLFADAFSSSRES